MDLQLVWGWQPALYLFLGGLGAGSFVVAACLYLFGKNRDAKQLAIVSWAALACLVIGLLLLLSELTFPLRGMMLWQSFGHFTSWMTIGAWLLFVDLIVIFVGAVALTKSLAKFVKLDDKEKPVKACFVVGGILSLGVCAYTGILLMSAPGVPFWNSLWLPLLFTVSALDTGVALNEIVFGATREEVLAKHHKQLAIVTIALIAVEALALAALLGVMGAGIGFSESSYVDAAQASVATLTGGQLAPYFWAAFVGVGLVVPLACAFVSRLRENAAGGVVTFVSAATVLIGGCTLRFLILLAGFHADIVSTGVAQIVF